MITQVSDLLQTEAPGLMGRAGVLHVVPPRSKQQGQHAYVLMPATKEIYLYSFTSQGRRFAYVSTPDPQNDALLSDVLRNVIPPEAPAGIDPAAVRAGCAMPAGSQTVVAQDMTILLAVERKKACLSVFCLCSDRLDDL